MKKLWIAIQWDIRRQQRYQIFTAAFVVTLLYVLFFLYFSLSDQIPLLVTLIFNDPAGLGMLFIGALYLMERSENTLQALSVTPLPPAHYVWSKTISLSLLATLSALAMALAGFGWSFHYGYFIAGIGLSASLFTLLGLALVVHCRSFNDYILRIAIFLTPVILPFFNLFGVTDTLWWYLIPSQASLLLMEAAFTPVTAWKLIYALIYLILCNTLAFRISLHYFRAQRSH